MLTLTDLTNFAHPRSAAAPDCEESGRLCTFGGAWEAFDLAFAASASGEQDGAMRIGIASSSLFTNAALVRQVLTHLHGRWGSFTVVTTGVEPVVDHAEEWAALWGCPCEVCVPNRSLHRQNAEAVRDAGLLSNVDVLLMFTGDLSHKVTTMLTLAEVHEVPTYVIRPDGQWDEAPLKPFLYRTRTINPRLAA